MRPGIAERSRCSDAVVLALCLAVAISAGCGSSDPNRRVFAAQISQGPARGPLRVNPAHHRYFADDAGRVVYLTGSHTWNSLQDWGVTSPPPALDYDAYLTFLTNHGHNFFRLYVWEQAAGTPWTSENVTFSPMPYRRTGPGTALDGLPRFNLHQFNAEYFTRLRSRVEEAGRRGIYVSVMLFNGWSVDGKRIALESDKRLTSRGNPWLGHPLNRENNVNGIDGDRNGNGEGEEVHELRNAAITAIQKAYISKVIDSVGDLDNVLWEISNESNAGSTQWQYAMIRYIQAEESRRAKRHPVGMTAEFPNGRNEDLFRSPADWVSPGSSGGGPYGAAPPAETAGKVLITDTDHIWGIGGSGDWVWKSFTRGLNPIFMDPYEADLIGLYPIYRHALPPPVADGDWEDIRRNLGYARSYSARLNLSAAAPRQDLASSGYCLANPGSEYLVYCPHEPHRGERLLKHMPAAWFPDSVEVNLSAARGELAFEWFDPASGGIVESGTTAGGGRRSFASPVRGGGAVLYLHALESRTSGKSK